jgi:hypothetical protein
MRRLLAVVSLCATQWTAKRFKGCLQPKVCLAANGPHYVLVQGRLLMCMSDSNPLDGHRGYAGRRPPALVQSKENFVKKAKTPGHGPFCVFFHV